MDLNQLLKKIDDNRKLIDGRRPLTTGEVRELDAYFKIGATYASNALEGNSLTLEETKVLLEDGITVGGKPIRDFYEATGHAKAYDYMLSIARNNKLTYTEDIILGLHRLFYFAINCEEAGSYRTRQVYITGTDYVPPAAEEVPAMMEEFVVDLNIKKDSMHPILFAAFAHKRLADIHPFVDGNGRTARLLMNLILVNKGYQVASVPPVWRHEYISALITAQRADNPSDTPFNILIAECVLQTQRDYCRMLKIPLR